MTDTRFFSVVCLCEWTFAYCLSMFICIHVHVWCTCTCIPMSMCACLSQNINSEILNSSWNVQKCFYSSVSAGMPFKVKMPAPEVVSAILNMFGCNEIEVLFDSPISRASDNLCSSYFHADTITTLALTGWQGVHGVNFHKWCYFHVINSCHKMDINQSFGINLWNYIVTS